MADAKAGVARATRVTLADIVNYKKVNERRPNSFTIFGRHSASKGPKPYLPLNVSNTASSPAPSRSLVAFPKALGVLGLSILALVSCSSEGRAQEPTLDRESYYRAVDYCRRNAWPNPMVL